LTTSSATLMAPFVASAGEEEKDNEKDDEKEEEK
jgi:hypothetical protein